MATTTISTINTSSYYNSLIQNGGIISVIVFIIILAFLLSYLGNNTNTYTTDNNETTGSLMVSIIIWILVIILLVKVTEYLFNFDITTSFNIFNTDYPEIDIDINEFSDPVQPYVPPVPEILYKKQVFNIPENEYTYKDAKALCNAYGSKLATYSQIEDAYNNGAEWCSYGWSEDQMILYPTQKKTYDKLQCIPGHEHDCGRPGINGGYIANPHTKFGVNCYGYKPDITTEEEEMMMNATSFPKTMKEVEFENRVDYWKSKLNNILVSPFNKTQWSE